MLMGRKGEQAVSRKNSNSTNTESVISNFDSKVFENFSNKWRARETYDIQGRDEFTETIELAPPDKTFQIYHKNHFKRTD